MNVIQQPDVSVIIPVYNRSILVKEAIRSAICQISINVEIIVVDDGSTDDTSQAVQSYGDRVILIQQLNSGAPKARNAGLCLSTGRYICFLDSDDMLESNSLKELVNALDQSGNDIAYGLWQEIDSNGVVFQKNIQGMPYPDAVDSLLDDWWCVPCAYLIRRDIAEKLIWDESLTSAQDFDFILRVALYGAKFINVDENVAYYRHHKSDRVSNRKIVEWVGNRRTVLGKAEAILKHQGCLTDRRKRILAKQLYRLAQVVFNVDKKLYFELLDQVLTLDREFLPEGRIKSALFKTLGFVQAESLLEIKRRFL